MGYGLLHDRVLVQALLSDRVEPALDPQVFRPLWSATSTGGRGGHLDLAWLNGKVCQEVRAVPGLSGEEP